MRLLLISLLTVSFSFSLTVFVLAHCGSTWVLNHLRLGRRQSVRPVAQVTPIPL